MMMGGALEEMLEGEVMMLVWTILVFVGAIAGGICAYFFFLLPKKDVKNKFMNWMKHFLNFDKMLLELILKISYLVAAIFITVWPLALVFTSAAGFLAAILTIVFGNIGLRVTYEFTLILIMTWKNTSEINRKMKEK